MADLIIDYDTLHEASASFQKIYDEFDPIGRTEGDLGGIWGSGDIKHAMDDFAGNWDYHRHKIMSAMQDLAKKMNDAATGFQEGDKKLKDGLDQSMKGGHRAK